MTFKPNAYVNGKPIEGEKVERIERWKRFQWMPDFLDFLPFFYIDVVVWVFEAKEPPPAGSTVVVTYETEWPL